MRTHPEKQFSSDKEFPKKFLDKSERMAILAALAFE